MLRVLHLFGRLNNGGAENGVMNIYRNLNRNQFQFDFTTNSQQEDFFETEILRLGGKVYRGLPPYRIYNYHAYYKAWRAFFRANPYDVIQVHTTNSAPPILKAAQDEGVVLRITHAHSASEPSVLRKVLVKLNRKSIVRRSNCLFTVSDDSAQFCFGQKAYRILNGVNAKQYDFDENTRQKVREELGFKPNDYVIGHIGRLCIAKNHDFILQIAKTLLAKYLNLHFCFAGDGELREQILGQAEPLGNRLHFLGVRSDIPDLLKAFDLFIMPSLYEGLPRSAVEAQASGLFCLLSDHITREVEAIPQNVIFLPINSIKPWLEAIEAQMQKPIARLPQHQAMKKSGFDIEAVAKFCENIYQSELAKTKNKAI